MKVFVPGEPAPQGSKTAFRHRSTGRIVMVESSVKVKPWREAVAAAYPVDLLDGPVKVCLTFRLPRGKSVRRALPHVKPDADKLARATLDALTGRAFRDDAQVVELHVAKVYADMGEPGAWITVTPAEPART